MEENMYLKKRKCKFPTVLDLKKMPRAGQIKDYTCTPISALPRFLFARPARFGAVKLRDTIKLWMKERYIYIYMHSKGITPFPHLRIILPPHPTKKNKE